MKKVFFLITLFVMVFAVIPQVIAQDMARVQALQTELEQIMTRGNARGNFTAQEMQRMEQIQNEIMQAVGLGGTGGGTSGIERQMFDLEQNLLQQGQRETEAQQQRDRQEQQQREQAERERRQWPSNAVLAEYGLSGLRQPNGATNVNWEIENGRLEITFNGNRTMFNDIVQQVNNLFGVRYIITEGIRTLATNDPNGAYAAYSESSSPNIWHYSRGLVSLNFTKETRNQARGNR